MGGDWEDCSIIILWDNKPAAVWPLSFSRKNQIGFLTSQGLPVLPPIFISDCAYGSRKRIIKGCLDVANRISIAMGIDSWESGESFSNIFGISDWHIESKNRGSTCTLYYDLFLDLKPDLTEIRKNFRKSYKPLINSGAKLWTVGLLKKGDESIWQEYRVLHEKVSGRKTRSDLTWNMQLQEIEKGKSFLVWLRSTSGEMVGGGLFNLTKDECVYAVGAYNRSLFDKPLGHVVQFSAITEMKERGIHWYKLGSRYFHAKCSGSTDKEVRIGEFKQGFASHVFPYYRLTYEVNYSQNNM